MVAFGEDEISGGEFLGGDQSHVEPQPLEDRKCFVEEQFLALPVALKRYRYKSRPQR
jgi:hypothetical protein